MWEYTTVLSILLSLPLFSNHNLNGIMDYKKLFDGCYVFTMGGCGDHPYLFYYFFLFSIINFCFALFWNIRTSNSIKCITFDHGAFEQVDCKLKDLRSQTRNWRKGHEVVIEFAEEKSANLIQPKMNYFQHGLYCLSQRKWKERVCDLLNDSKCLLNEGKLKPDMIEKVYPPGSRILEKELICNEGKGNQKANLGKSKRKTFMVIALLHQTKRDELFERRSKGSFQDDGEEENQFNISRMTMKYMHTQKKECSTSSHSSDPLINLSLNV